MEEIMKHYGPAILVTLTLLVLGGIIYGLYTTGFLTTQFQNALTQFFTNMNGFVPSVTP